MKNSVIQLLLKPGFNIYTGKDDQNTENYQSLSRGKYPEDGKGEGNH